MSIMSKVAVIFAAVQEQSLFRLACGALFTWMLITYIWHIVVPPSYPYVGWSPWEGTYLFAKIRFLIRGKKIVADGLKKINGPFWVVTDVGPCLIADPSYIEDINKEPGLSFSEGSRKVMLADLPGYEIFDAAPGHMIPNALRTSLTPNLSKFTDIMSNEMRVSLEDEWGDAADWKDVKPNKSLARIIARLSAMVFVGPRLARDPSWLDISVNYTVNLFTSIMIMRIFPKLVQLLLCYTLPMCRKVRAETQQCRDLLAPLLFEREQERAEAAAAGKEAPLHNDAIDWIHLSSQGRAYDAALCQLTLTMASIHTTTDLMSQAMYYLDDHPEVVEELRNEAMTVVSKYGLNKTALFEMRLLDSVLKETQRLKPVGIVFMNRIAMKDVTLKGDLKIKKGELLFVSSQRMWEEAYYAEAETFDPYRFYRQRSTPGLEHKSHFVSTSTESTGFGHGRSACPGRFFASNELKVAFAHILLKYDFRVKQGVSAKPLIFGANMAANPNAILQVRKRGLTPEVAALGI